jgi:single-strand DNA-binding protein
VVNKIILIGHLAADPDVRVTATGVHVANLRVATNTYAGQEDGVRREFSDFHTLVVFGKSAEFAANLRKGRLVYAEGRSQTRTWDPPEGQRRYITEVVVDSLKVLGPRPEGDGEQ